MPTFRINGVLLLFTLFLIACAPVVLPTAEAPAGTVPPVSVTDADFTRTVLTTGLAQPWEIIYGPDDYLWVTERMGKRVLHINPTDGALTTLVTIDEVYAASGQQGLLGMTLHPEFLQETGNDYVYVVFHTNPNRAQSRDRRMTLRRYTYDRAALALVDPVDLFTTLPGSTDHNGARITFGNDGKLYYPIGDLGANNLGNYCRPNDAQTLPTAAEIAAADWRHYVGKILRLNPDGSIPDDNPTWAGVQSHVYSVGHRNVQGLTAGNGTLYAAEHGPKSDDEINRIVAGQNYGWPYVAGYQDDQAYVYASWSDATVPCTTLEYSDYEIPAAVPQQPESAWSDPDFTPPLYTFGTVPDAYDFQPAVCDPNFYICWPTIAPTGMAYYGADSAGVPGWGNSLLVAALKTGTIYRLPLTADGQELAGEPLPFFQTTNRYRDVAIAPDGRTFYVITDNSGSTQDAQGLPTNELADPGAILVFVYTE